MRIAVTLITSLLGLSACNFLPFDRGEEHRHEHRRDVGDACHDQDDCERGLVCARPDGGSDHDWDDEGVCTATTPPPAPPSAPPPCASIASVIPGGTNHCAPTDGGALVDGSAPVDGS